MLSLIDVSGMENAPHVLDRWWVLENGGYTSAPLANTRFTYRDSEWSTGTNTITEGALQLERMTNVWNMMPTATNTTTNTLDASAQPLIPSFWTAAELTAPLPVELLSFTGERTSDREVLLHWTTATEHNNAGFEVWRMIEGEDAFTEVGWVDGAGDSQQLIHYQLPDENTATQTSYYQLKQVDFDGQHAWSPMIAVEGARTLVNLVLYPNPTRGEFFIQGDRSTWSAVHAVDAHGRVAAQWAPDARFDASALPDGTYVVVVTLLDGGQAHQRLVIAR